MPHDVFISYSSQDRAIADSIVSNFEKNGIRCWYAPRDIDPGVDWGEAITEAINACPVMLLVFSGNANRSKHVLDELYYALDEEKIVIPFRVENLNPSGAMRLHLASLHWLDAYDPSWESHMDRLFDTVSANISREISGEREKYAPGYKIESIPAGKSRILRILSGILLLAMITLFTVFGIPRLRAINAASDTQIESTQAKAVLPTATVTLETIKTVTLDPTPTIEIIPLGSEANPIVWMFLPRDDTDFDELTKAMREVAAAFESWSGGLFLKAIPAINQTAIVDALCDGETSVGSMMAIPYLAALERGCANAEFVWTSNNVINYGGMIVTRADSGISNLADLAGKTFCIPAYGSSSGWLLPSLEMRAAGIDLINSQITIVDYGGDHVQVIQAVYDGECDAGGAYFDVRQHSGISNVEEDVIILAETIPMPFLSISFGSAVDDQNAQLLRQFIAQMASDEEALDLMAGLFAGFSPGEANLIEINDYYYDGIKDLIERAGTSATELILQTE